MRSKGEMGRFLGHVVGADQVGIGEWRGWMQRRQARREPQRIGIEKEGRVTVLVAGLRSSHCRLGRRERVARLFESREVATNGAELLLCPVLHRGHGALQAMHSGAEPRVPHGQRYERHEQDERKSN